ncbi:MAG: chitobiase/beta-hexosaminidase C-terminal domain-containing protein [archaeon]
MSTVKKNKKKGQVSIEILAIIGIVIIGGIIVGSFYMSGISKKTAEATEIANTSSNIYEKIVDYNGSIGSTSYVCGNNKVEGTELCDVNDMGAYTGLNCASLKLGSGSLDCYDNNCTIDISDCSGSVSAFCGDDIIEGSEQCEPGPPLNLNSKDCISLGYKGGTLNCYSEMLVNGCKFNTSACTSGDCGDLVCSGTETPITCPTDCAVMPTADPLGGTYTNTTLVTLSTTTPNARIYYTVNGTDPDPSTSPEYTGKISISSDTNLYARAYTSTWDESDRMEQNYIIGKLATPTATPAGSTYSSPQTIVLNCATPGADIYYSIEYSDYDEINQLYVSPISISEDATIYAQAFKVGYDPSAFMIEKYLINGVATPIADPLGGVYTDPQIVVLDTLTSGASIYYTTDGSTPTTSSTLYFIPIPINLTTILKAIAVKGLDSSAVMTEKYEITGQVATPEADPVAGTYVAPQTVELSSATFEAKIYYTTDGTDPSMFNGIIYVGTPIDINETTTLKAIAIKPGFADSNIFTGVYTINVPSKIVFHTDGWIRGDFGGFTFADDLCNAEASAAGLLGTYKAWLSDDTKSAASRLNHSLGPYKLVDSTVVAKNWVDLIDGDLFSPINLTADGELTKNDYSWTNTTINGSIAGDSCGNWTNRFCAFGTFGLIGSITEMNNDWTEWQAVGCCQIKVGFYCFEQ